LINARFDGGTLRTYVLMFLGLFVYPRMAL
jgi:hypothetical protein